MPSFSHSAGRILIVRPGALGDTILALPAVRALRRAAGPAARLEVVGYPVWLKLALNPLHADAAHSIDRSVFAGFVGGAFHDEILRFLSAFSLVVAWCHDNEGWLASVAREAGVDCLQAAPYTSERHVSDHLLGTLAPLGIEAPSTTAPEIVLPTDARLEAQAFLRERGLGPRRFLAVHPGSGSPSKNWPATRFARIASRARAAGLEVLVISGEADQEPVRELLSRLTWTVPVAAGLEVTTLAGILEEAAAYVGNDSGVTHLAAATGVPTVALFGPTDPRAWAPRGRSVAVVAHDTDPDAVWCEVLGGSPYDN